MHTRDSRDDPSKANHMKWKPSLIGSGMSQFGVATTRWPVQQNPGYGLDSKAPR